MKAKRRIGRTIGLATGVGAILGGPLVLWAQDMGGTQLTYGIDSRVAGHSNIDLDPDDGKSSIVWDTTLSFGYLTGTQVSYLGLDASVLLREKLAGDATVARGFINPRVNLSFGHEAAGGRIDGDVFLRETDLTDNQTLDDFDINSGTRRDYGGNVQLSWGQDSRVAWRLGADVIYSDYFDSPGNANRNILTYSGGATLDLSEVWSLDIGVSRQNFQEEGSDDEITNSVSAGLVRAMQNGTANLDASYVDTPDGSRQGLSVGRSLELPDGNLFAQIGVTHTVSGSLALTGALGYSRALPRGGIDLDFSHNVQSSSENDSEVEVTRASASISQDLTERSSISANVGLGQQTYTDDDQPTVRNVRAGIDFSYDLGQDWQATTGIGYTLRKDDETASDNSIYIGIRRTFERRY